MRQGSLHTLRHLASNVARHLSSPGFSKLFSRASVRRSMSLSVTSHKLPTTQGLKTGKVTNARFFINNTVDYVCMYRSFTLVQLFNFGTSEYFIFSTASRSMVGGTSKPSSGYYSTMKNNGTLNIQLFSFLMPQLIKKTNNILVSYHPARKQLCIIPQGSSCPSTCSLPLLQPTSRAVA